MDTGKHRIAFSNAVCKLWDDVEAEWNENKRSLEEDVEAKNKIIAEQAAKLEQLEAEIAGLRPGNVHLRDDEVGPDSAIETRVRSSSVSSSLSEEDRHPSSDGPPTERCLKTYRRIISPPSSGSPALAFQEMYTQTENVPQLEQLVQTEVMQGGLETITQEHEELIQSYDQLRTEFEEYRAAHVKLQNQYHKNKKIWGVWVENDRARRDRKSEMKRKKTRGGSTIRPATTSPTSKAYNTPATTEPRYSTPPRPPTVSPIKPLFRPTIAHQSPKKRSLFPLLKKSAEAVTDDDIGKDMPSKAAADLAALRLPNQEDNISSDPPSDLYLPSSVSETQPERQIPTYTHIPASAPITRVPALYEEETQSSDIENAHVEGPIMTEESIVEKEIGLPPALPTPEAELQMREGMSPFNPVEIKSESKFNGSDGPGYHEFDHESLDLDDLGERPEQDSPRKRRKVSKLLKRESSLRRGKEGVEGYPQDRPLPRFRPSVPGFVQNNDATEEDVPSLPMVQLNDRIPSGLRTDSQLVRAKTPEGMASAGPRIVTPISATISPRDAISARTRQSAPRNTTGPFTTSSKTPNQTSKPGVKRRKDTRDATIRVLEDGTDGDSALGDEGTRDLYTNIRIDELLSTPAPRSPSLKPLSASAANSRGVTKKAGGGDGFVTPTIPRSKMKVVTEPISKTVQSANPSSNPRKRAHDTTELDISNFRVNPRANQGVHYAFHETVRDREARKCLPGCMKACCKDLGKFVEAAGLPEAARKGPRWNSSPPSDDPENKDVPPKQFVQRFGKHRTAYARPQSPPGFWDADFPDTQTLDEQRRRAEEERLRKVDVMKKEADKGHKGRYMYK